ncbi:DUF4159 domain-containing protein [Candidatus Palauibacter sp.]|uniref:DUF4159 domain-containing protein n=1 Tax=Candidatus Palauibacter sp. TaxID=3101350 RepID=UPI003B0205ED
MIRPRLAAASAVVSVLAAIALAGATGSLAPDRAAVAAETAAETATSPARSEAGLREALLEREPALAQTWAEWGRDFYFTRAVYSGSRGWGRGGGSWATDYPKADRQFLFILHRLLTMLDLSEWENPVSLADPELRRFPFLYMLEVGYMRLTEPEIQGLRNYLEAGGFLVVDDFWGPDAWANFEYHMSLVLPNRRIQPIPDGHPIFHQFYDIEQILTVPSIGNAMRGRYEECRGPCEPTVSGIFDDRGELMVVINHNTDLGDAWEWSENPYYPIDRSTYAYELAINYIIYGLSH